MVKQRIKNPSKCYRKIGPSGERVNLTFVTRPANSGIVFRRMDMMPAVAIRGSHAVHDTFRLSTCLEIKRNAVATIEHLAVHLGLE